MCYDNKYNLMDQKLFPNDSDYTFKENPVRGTQNVTRVAKTDDEIVAAVTDEMKDTLGIKLEP